MKASIKTTVWDKSRQELREYIKDMAMVLGIYGAGNTLYHIFRGSGIMAAINIIPILVLLLINLSYKKWNKGYEK